MKYSNETMYNILTIEKEKETVVKRRKRQVESSFEIVKSSIYDDLKVRLYHDKKNDSFCLLVLFNNKKLVLKSQIEQNFNVYFNHVELLKNLVIDNIKSFK